MTAPALPRPRGLAVRIAAAVAVFATTLILLYGTWLAVRSYHLYASVKLDGRCCDVPIHRYDPILGYAAVPDVNTTEHYPGGYTVPIRFDSNGLRIPSEPERVQDGSKPYVLALGCSFTFGMACKAEEAFPYRVAEGLHGTALNAGLGGYGLVHMVLRARSLIPTYAPEWVLVEYAPWLIARSLAPVSQGVHVAPMPSAFFGVRADGRFTIEAPPYPTNYFSLAVSDYARAQMGACDFASFLWHAALPFYTYSDLNAIRYRLQSHPVAAPNDESLVKTFYGEIVELAQRCRSQVCIVILAPGGITTEQLPPHHLQGLRALSGVTIVDACRALNEHLPHSTPDAYDKAYGIWHGTPPQLIDRHPNPAAHALIAAAILDAIR